MMKIRSTSIAAGFILSVTSLVSSAAEPVSLSKLSGFAGAYRGSVNFVGAPLNGTRASFTASRSNEIGTLRLTTLESGSGTTITEIVAIRGNQVNYSIVPGAGGAAAAKGTARITKSVLRYTVPITVGGIPYVMQGVTRKSNRRLNVTHTFTGSSSPPVINYSLSKIGN